MVSSQWSVVTALRSISACNFAPAWSILKSCSAMCCSMPACVARSFPPSALEAVMSVKVMATPSIMFSGFESSGGSAEADDGEMAARAARVVRLHERRWVRDCEGGLLLSGSLFGWLAHSFELSW